MRYQSTSWNTTAIKSNDEPDIHRKKPLLNLCKTRWAERQIAYTHFHQAYEHIVQALEVIVYDLHHDAGYDENLLGPWSRGTKSRASSFLSAITNFDFVAKFFAQSISRGSTCSVAPSHRETAELDRRHHRGI